jgi:hypothetical protein
LQQRQSTKPERGATPHYRSATQWARDEGIDQCVKCGALVIAHPTNRQLHDRYHANLSEAITDLQSQVARGFR